MGVETGPLGEFFEEMDHFGTLLLGIGGTEFVIILIFAFLIFGPDKLPDIARTIGRAIAKFRDAQNEVNEVIRKEVYDPATDAENPLQKAADKADQLNKKAGQTESFAERKARYDKIRAERKAREDAARAANAEKVAESTAKADAAEATDADIDELLGVAPKPAPSSPPVSEKPVSAPEGGDA